MEENIFSKVGFVSNPFNPVGVTSGLDEQVPPPVGVRNQIKIILKELEQSKEYRNNMPFAVIGRYGSGKSELMKYVYRYFQNHPGVKVYYTIFSEKNIDLYRILKKAVNKTNQQKNERLIVFIDEIDDIPRLIEDNLIDTSIAEKFFKDLRAFLERNDKFSEFNRIMLVLGFGNPSWDYVSQKHPDISEERFRAKKIELREFEEWQSVGMIHRNLYFYANDELRKLIDEKGFYPIPEGYCISLSRISALSHSSTIVNPRVVVQLMDKIILYLINKTPEGSLIAEFKEEYYREILSQPEILGLNEKEFEQAVKSFYNSLISVIEELSKEFSIDKETLHSLFFRIYFNHLPATFEELSKIIENEVILKKVLERLENVGLLEKYYYYSVSDFPDASIWISNLETHQKEYGPIKLLKRYSPIVDRQLARQNYDPQAIPSIEYDLFLLVRPNDYPHKIDSKLLDILRDLSGKEVYMLSKQRWDKEIRERQVQKIQLKGLTLAKKHWESLDHNRKSVKFAEELKNLLKNQVNVVTLTRPSNLNKKLVLTDQPKTSFIFISPSPTSSFEEQAKKYLDVLLNDPSDPEIEGFVFFVSTYNRESNFKPDKKKQMALQELIEKHYPHFIGLKYFGVFSIFDEDLLYLVFPQDTKEESDFKEKRSEILNKIITINRDEVRVFLRENNLIPFEERPDRKKSDTKKLLQLIEDLWRRLLQEETVSEKDYMVLELKNKFGQEFVFHYYQKFSSLENKLIRLLIKKAPEPYTYKNVKPVLERYFALSCSLFEIRDFLRLLEKKGILVDLSDSPTAPKNFKYEKNKGQIQRDQYNYSLQLTNEIQDNLNKIMDLKNTEFFNESIRIYVDLEKYQEILKKSHYLLEELDSKLNEIENYSKKFFKEYSSDDLIELILREKDFDQKIEPIIEGYELAIGEQESVLEEIEQIRTELKEFEKLSDELSLNEYERKEWYNKVQQILSATNDLKIKTTQLRKLLNQLKNRSEENKKILQLKQDLKDLVLNLNKYLDNFESLNEMDEKHWETLFEFSSDGFLPRFKNYLKKKEIEEIKTDFLEEELLNSIKDTNEIYHWMTTQLRKIHKEVEEWNSNFIQTIEFTIIRPLYNQVSWLLERGNEKIPNWSKLRRELYDIKQNIADIKDMYKKNDLITKINLTNLISSLEEFRTKIMSLFPETYEVVLELGKNGPGKEVVLDNYYDEFGQELVDRTIEELKKLDLIKYTLTT